MSSLGEYAIIKENVKIMPEALVRIYCFICSDWTSLKLVKTTLTDGSTVFEDACTECDTGYAYLPFSFDDMTEITKSLKTIGVTRKQSDDIISMISSNKNTKNKFNESFGSVYTSALLNSARKREKEDGPEDCSICLEIPESKKELQCSHIVCSSCFEQMNKEQCPLCRCYFEWNGDLKRILY